MCHQQLGFEVFLKTAKQLVQMTNGMVVQQLGKRVWGLKWGLSMWTFQAASLPVRVCSSVLPDSAHGHFSLIGDSRLQLTSSM